MLSGIARALQGRCVRTPAGRTEWQPVAGVEAVGNVDRHAPVEDIACPVRVRRWACGRWAVRGWVRSRAEGRLRDCAAMVQHATAGGPPGLPKIRLPSASVSAGRNSPMRCKAGSACRPMRLPGCVPWWWRCPSCSRRYRCRPRHPQMSGLWRRNRAGTLRHAHAKSCRGGKKNPAKRGPSGANRRRNGTDVPTSPQNPPC